MTESQRLILDLRRFDVPGNEAEPFGKEPATETGPEPRMQAFRGGIEKLNPSPEPDEPDPCEHQGLGHDARQCLTCSLRIAWIARKARESNRTRSDASNWRDRVVIGGAFLFEQENDDPPIWGEGDRGLWETGESLLIYSPPGVGKTTIAGCLIRGRLGLETEFLGMPMRTGSGRVLYFAMDRPKQVRRALARQFQPSEREFLDKNLVIWEGPLLDRLADVPTLFADLASELDADTIVIDSLKDTGIRLSEDEGGLTYNIARQNALAADIEMLELHHARKATSEGRKRLTIDDVYGSTWLAAGSGTVLALAGNPSESRAELYTLRAPRGDLQMQIEIDRNKGTIRSAEQVHVIDVLRESGEWMLAREVAAVIEGTGSPSKAAEARARRALRTCESRGQAEAKDFPSGSGGRSLIKYRAPLMSEERPN